MKKNISTLVATVLTLTAVTATAFAEDTTAPQPAPLANWAFAGITLDNEDLGIGSVYYVEDYFSREGILNPVTVEPYTAEELEAIAANAVDGAEGYITIVPDDAVVGISVYGMEGQIFWYNTENADKLLASSDALVLDAETGEVSSLSGEAIANALPALENWAYAGISLNNEDYGVSSVYYPASHFQAVLNGELETVNPITVAPYTAEEVRTILSGAVESSEGYVSSVPEEAAIGLGVFGAEDIIWFDAENAAVILSSADPLILNAETGEVNNLDGDVVATAIAA